MSQDIELFPFNLAESFDLWSCLGIDTLPLPEVVPIPVPIPIPSLYPAPIADSETGSMVIPRANLPMRGKDGKMPLMPRPLGSINFHAPSSRPQNNCKRTSQIGDLSSSRVVSEAPKGATAGSEPSLSIRERLRQNIKERLRLKMMKDSYLCDHQVGNIPLENKHKGFSTLSGGGKRKKPDDGQQSSSNKRRRSSTKGNQMRQASMPTFLDAALRQDKFLLEPESFINALESLDCSWNDQFMRPMQYLSSLETSELPMSQALPLPPHHQFMNMATFRSGPGDIRGDSSPSATSMGSNGIFQEGISPLEAYSPREMNLFNFDASFADATDILDDFPSPSKDEIYPTFL